MKIFIICLAILASVESFAQENLEFKAPQPVSDSVQVQPEEIYDFVDVAAEFPGGNEKLMRYIRDHLNYPPEIGGLTYQGTVYVGFVVERSGAITNVKILKGLHIDLDKEAKRVVKGMPKWKSAQNRGKTVRSRYTLPIKFRLQ